jgi:transcription elongation factor GreA
MQTPWRKKEELLALKKQSDEPIPLTPKGFEQLKQKLARLKENMPKLAQEAGRTADYGDRSENAEYKDAKANLRRTQTQIFYLEDQLKRVHIITPHANTSDTIELGSTVTLETTDGKRHVFQILGSRETNPSKGKISNESPLGKALLHQKTGACIHVTTPQGGKKYKILEII